MDIEALSPLFTFLAIFAVFQLILPFTLMPFLKYLLNGPLAPLSANYFKDFAKEKFDEASRQNDPDKAWEEVALAKIREMGHSRTSYEKRKRNLTYINSIEPTKRIAAGLIDILPEQHRIDFQQELACFICTTLEKLGLDSKENSKIKVGAIKNTLSAPLYAWSDLFSAWLSSFVVLLNIWNKLDNYSLLTLALLCILFLGFTCYPILKVNVKPSSIIAYLFFCIFSALSILALYANTNHAGTNSLKIDLSSSGYDGTVINIIYPKWVRFDNAIDCDKLIPYSVLMERGTLSVPVQFNYDSELFSAMDSECKAFVPSFNFSAVNGQSFQFYLLPLDINTLGKNDISVTPILLLSGKEVFIENATLITKVEPAFWRIVHQLYFFLAGGTVSFSFILAQVISSLRRKNS